MHRSFDWKTCRKDPPGTRRGRWENNIKMDIKLDGKTSTGSSGSIQGQGAGSCEEGH